MSTTHSPADAGLGKFQSRPMPMDELKRRISPQLPLHELPADQPEIDPLTYEVLRHRMWSITEEMGETLKRMSGSHAVTEANDMDVAICDELGQPVQVGLYNTGLISSMDLAIYWILQHRSDSPGIHEGDMFLTNDPWVGGGLHQNDTAIIAPIFWEGELFAWTSAICHLVDVGGSKPGSSDLEAVDVFSEAVPTPPIAVVRGGQIQADVFDSFLRRSRLPHHVELDLRSQIGANQLAQRRLTELVERYGANTVKAVMKRMMNDAESRLRARLSSIPDGSWSAVSYLEQSGIGDRDLHKLAVTLTKTGAQMSFDFTGTAPQSGMINCPYSGMRAGVIMAVMPLLAGDIPWSAGGLLRCFDIVTEEGTINNATFPAAVGWGSITSGLGTMNVVSEVIGRMVDTSPDLVERVQASCTSTYDVVTLAGVDREGAPNVNIVFTPMAGGFGARPYEDGADTAGSLNIPMGRAPDVEMQELSGPYLFLWRREEVDSGGAGRFRGGLSASTCLIPYETSSPLFGAFSTNGKARAEVNGLAGAYPGGAGLDVIVRDADIPSMLAAGVIPASLEEMGGHIEVVPNRMETLINLVDAIYIQPTGGAGYGDPLLREPAAVALDVANGKVSAVTATNVYGVCLLPDGGADVDATIRRRSELRESRLGARPAREVGGGGEFDASLDENLAVVHVGSSEVVRCRQCGHDVGARGSDLATALVRRDAALPAAIPGMRAKADDYVDQELVFRAYFCPGCATQLRTEVVPSDEAPIIR
ncbi:MAG: hydantoinase B/oxoprolinase family protein [Microbacterium sp.]|uniref:hydantoinase B/oxoprolinase family protein n=1 Tax=Microbacterium sp. TaxID=51671 RepID=UPI001ACBD581|nr:hydantoinase B/oxoprolinase family protein [Microbacterium sp.]MBN9155783.1 hydantoinase B/oxoprolinase family protein [Microbacterium sp.]